MIYMKRKKEKTLAEVSEVQSPPVRGKRAKKPAPKSQSTVVEDANVQNMNEETDERETACKALAEIMVKHEQLLNEVKHLRMLLAAFNALTREDGVKLVKPAVDTPYWYIRAMSIPKSFEVVPCTWNDWKSDHYRYVQGNMFLDQAAANIVCQELNTLLAEL